MNRLILNSSEYIKPLFISKFIKKNNNHSFLWIINKNTNYQRIVDYIKFFSDKNLKVLYIPDLDTSYDEIIKPDKQLVFSRINTIYEIINNYHPNLIITYEEILEQKTIAGQTLLNNILNLKAGDKILDIADSLSKIGYIRQLQVSGIGEFSIRGDILDVYAKKPYRINFFGNNIENIKEFDVSSQLSASETLNSINILPVNEIIGETCQFKTYFGKNFIIFKDEESKLTSIEDNLVQFSNFSDKTTNDKKILLNYKEITFQKKIDIFTQLKNLIKKSDKIVIIAVPNIALAKRLSQILQLDIIKDFSSCNKNAIGIFEVDQSFTTETITIISANDIYTDHLHKTKIKINKDDILKNLSSLLEGDFIVHINHGIGQFKKLRTLNIENKKHDFLELEYFGNEKLLLPVENINLLSRYNTETTLIKLDKLGSKSWERRKENAKSRITELAFELIKTAAAREKIKTEIPVYDLEEFEKFCNEFEHIETPDQTTAINDVINDLNSRKLIDRLICGDVGFGKTEIALRAAYIISREKQVAVVVPTTILCRQHFEVFQRRFEKFNTKVVSLSRISNEKKIKESIENGEAKIIIGTHGLFKQNFKNLGMLIIDEEQHFGVKQKELLKKNYNNLHVLTLTATPIPRTMQLSISGIKDISIIATPPIERIPKRIVITPIDLEIISEAINREINRGGQIFYTCPRIEDIDDIKNILLKINSNYKVLHGKMPQSEIVKVLNEFKNKKFDILVSTNIIESGIDIRNVNTIIVHNSHMFGLASMYQLSGRIGRANVQGFAYFTLPENKEITKNAKRRLKVIQGLEKLGSGFSLSSYDMDIRGSGNILGEEQSGYIREIGIELYQKMLKNAILNQQDEKEIIINLNIPVLIPDTYIEDEDERISYYQKISAAESKVELLSIKSILENRFGKLPREVSNLLHIIDLKNIAKKLNIKSIESGPNGTLLTFLEVKNIDKLLEIARNAKGAIEFKPNNKVFINKKIVLKEFLKDIAIDT